MNKILYLAIALLLFSCTENTPHFQMPYRLYASDDIRNLPKALQEVSGLSYIHENQIACVQDEAGIIYIYDWEKDKITKKVDFQVFDDFEGVEIVNGNGYALTSKGDLYEIPNLNEQPILHKVKMPKPPNFEGLGYNEASKQLLLVPKEELTKGKMLIFQYDIEKQLLNPKPWIEISNSQLRIYFESHQIKYKIKKKFPFSPSGIATHPITKNIYIVADVGKTLAILSPTGKILHVEKLNKKLFPKPEGITFFPNGDMVISSEGDIGKLVRLRYLGAGVVE